jgi:signal transduction histidine kinase
VYAECDATRASIFVRDRGAGFDRGGVPSDRRGIVESIEGRMARAGGSAKVS